MNRAEPDMSDDSGQRLIRAIFDGGKELRAVASSLRGLAHAFDRVGNQTVADELIECAASIDANWNEIRDAHGLHLTEQANVASRTSNAMLKAALVGAIGGDARKAYQETMEDA